MVARFLLLIILGTLNFQHAVAQSNLMGSSGIMGKLQNIIDKTEERGGLEVVRIEADVIRVSKESVRTLDPAYTHTIAAVGSNHIKHIEIEVYQEINRKWVLVQKDDDDSVAVVAITPSSMAEYKIVVKVPQFFSGHTAGHYGLIFIIEEKIK